MTRQQRIITDLLELKRLQTQAVLIETHLLQLLKEEHEELIAETSQRGHDTLPHKEP